MGGGREDDKEEVVKIKKWKGEVLKEREEEEESRMGKGKGGEREKEEKEGELNTGEGKTKNREVILDDDGRGGNAGRQTIDDSKRNNSEKKVKGETIEKPSKQTDRQ